MSLWQPIRRSGHPYRARTMLGLGLFATLNVVCCLAVVPTEQAQGPQPPEPPPPPPPPPPVAMAACTVGVAPPVPGALRTFYVNATAGNDAASGTTASAAWKTLDKANAMARPGDLFLLAGTFTGQWINPGQSGTADHKIVFRALGTGAVLDGGRYDGVVNLDRLSHIVVDGLELRNAGYPVSIQKGASGNWLRNVYLRSSPHQGITISAGTDNRIEDSRIEGIGSEADNAGEAIFLQNGANRNVIARNVITNAGHGLVILSYQDAAEVPSDDNLIEGNDLSNPWANAVILSGKARRTLVQCNRIHNTADGSGPNTARAGIEIEGESNVIRFNEIFSVGRMGITLQGRTFAGFVQNATNNQIYNNTFWRNGNGTDKSDGSVGFESVEIVVRDIGNVRNNVIENNIFWDDHGFVDHGTRYAMTLNAYFADVPLPTGSMIGNIIRNNIFPAGQSVLLVINRSVANQAYNLTRAEGSFPGWERNMQVDPLFVNEAANDVRLRAGSPAIGAGVTILGAAGLGPAPDLGAHQVR